MKKRRQQKRVTPNPMWAILDSLEMTYPEVAEEVAAHYHQHTPRKLNEAFMAIIIGFSPARWFLPDIRRYLQGKGVDTEKLYADLTSWYSRYPFLQRIAENQEKGECQA